MAIQKLKLTHFWDPGAEPQVDDQSRFFSLKRSIDGGLDTPELWAEYLVLALRLGAREQARIAMRHLRGTQRGLRLLEQLTADGALDALKRKSAGASAPQQRASSPPGQPAAAAHNPARRRADTGNSRGNGRQPQSRQQQRTPPRNNPGRSRTSAPPRTNRQPTTPPRTNRQPTTPPRTNRQPTTPPRTAHQPPREPEVEAAPVRETVREEALDALQYLMLGSVPMKIVWFTVSFPAAIAVGQILLPAHPGRLALLGVLPSLIVACVVMHYARVILLTSADGAEEPPQMYTDVLVGSVKASFVSLILILACVGPGVLAISLGKPLVYAIPLLAFGLLYLPMALLGVTVRRSLEAALPHCVFRGMAAHSIDYIKIWGFAMLSAVVPLVALALIGNVPVHMQLAVGGPLSIVPGLFLARLLGRFFYSRRMTLAHALGVRLRRTRKVVNAGSSARGSKPVIAGRRIDANPPNGRHRVAPGDASRQTVDTPAQMGKHTHTPLRRRQ